MRETRSRIVEELKAKTPVRWSPRFHHADVTVEENPRTPTPVTKRSRVGDSLPITKKHRDGDGVSPNLGKESCELRKVTRSGKEYGSSDRSDRGADVNLSDSQKKQKRLTTNSVCRSQSLDVISRDNECGRMYGKKERRATKSKSFEKFGKGVRRSARLARAVDQCENGDAHDLDKQKLIGKIVTKSMVHDFASKHGKVGGFTVKGVSCRRARVLSNERRANAGIDSCKITIGNDKRRTPLSLGPAKVVRSSNGRHKMVSGDDAKPGFDVNYFKPCRRRQDTERSIVPEVGAKNSERQVFFGECMKRDQVEEESEVVGGWTKEQDSALRKAYFTAKPTPQFWKKVAKMVPRKSAQECFDRIHSDYPTPSEPRARSRVTTKKPASPISFSASKLLKKTVNIRPRRRNTFLAQKTVRKLLEKQQNEDQDYQADFFSVFEPTMDLISFNFEAAAFDSPAANQKSSILTRFGEESPSVHSIHRSRLVNSKKAALVSPPVLKQIKNKALHERYIDQLHRRDAKRKAESLRMQRIEKQTSKKANDLTANSVQIARDVLVNNAYDAILRIRSLQSNADDNAIDGDDTSCSIEDEDEDGLC